MRTDAKLDRQQVLCPNRGQRCRVGDMFTYQQGEERLTGRMLARIVSAPNLDGGAPYRDYICAVVLLPGFTICERWVDPADVIEVMPVTKQKQDAVACFLSADLRKTAKRDIGEARRYASELWSSLKTMRKYYQDRADYEDGKL